MNVRLDSSGSIDTILLQKELQNALETDIMYKQTDNMKKKAVKIAKDYDEFKNFVACAHLKTLCRAEVESLGEKKKGWKKSNALKKTGAVVLEQEEKLKILGSESNWKAQRSRKPKSSLDLDRDWRRLEREEKITYMRHIGLLKFQKLLKADCDATLLEDVIRTISEIISIRAGPALHPFASNQSQEENQGKDSELEPEASFSDEEIFQWLRGCTEFYRFSLNVQFVDDTLRKHLVGWMIKACREDEMCGDLIAKYSV